MNAFCCTQRQPYLTEYKYYCTTVVRESVSMLQVKKSRIPNVSSLLSWRRYISWCYSLPKRWLILRDDDVINENSSIM